MYSEKVPGLQLSWDNTSLSIFKQCPRKYYYSIVKGWRKPHILALDYGIAFHSALEFYERKKALSPDLTRTELVRLTAAEVIRLASELPYTDTNGKPIDTKRTPTTLVRAVLWYIEQHKNDPLETLPLPASNGCAVELSFSFDSSITTAEGEPYLLCGHIDRVVSLNGDLWAVDLKTTASALGDFYFNNYSPDTQVSLYTIASKVIFSKPAKGVIIDAIQLQVNSNQFSRGFIFRTTAQSEEWLKELPYWLAQAELCALKQYYPQNDKSCYWCDFKPICGTDPSNRERLLSQSFKVVKWDPTIVRN